MPRSPRCEHCRNICADKHITFTPQIKQDGVTYMLRRLYFCSPNCLIGWTKERLI